MDNLPDSSSKNAAEPARHHDRMRQDWDNLIEDIIQDGVEKGLFDNLKGKGKPLNLTKNPYEAGQELAHSILKDNDLPPAWIMERNQILAGQDLLRKEIQRQWEWHSARFEAADTAVTRDHLTLSWDDACLKWADQIQALNKRILTYNLKRPSANLELFKLNLEEELKRDGVPRWLR